MMDKKRKRLSSILLNLHQNDDESEKRARRLSVKRASIVAPIRAAPSTPTKSARIRNSAPFLSPLKIKEFEKETLSEKQLSELYTETIRLAATGKITQKNTWSINLIDYIDDLLSNEKKAADAKVTKSSSLFRKASNTIDASIKIYSSRVDSVHSQMFKVLGGLSSRFEEPAASKENPADESAQPASASKGSKPLCTLLRGDKAAALSLREGDFGYEVDPMFFKMASAFDEGGARGLLLNNLEVGEELQIIFDSDLPLQKDVAVLAVGTDGGVGGREAAEKQKKPKKEGEKTRSEDIILKSDEFGALLESVSKEAEESSLCPLLDAFAAEIEAVEAQISALASGGGENVRKEARRLSELPMDTFGFEGVGAEGGDSEVEVDFDPPRENYDHINEKGDESAETQLAIKEELAFTEQPPPPKSLSLSADAFSNWAGPNFWRFNRRAHKREVTTKHNGEGPKKGLKTPRKEHFIDFKKILENNENFEIMSKTPNDAKKAKILKVRKLKRKRAFNTLPEDMHLNADLFLRPFYRPHLMARIEYKREDLDNENLAGGNFSNLRWYNYANPNDQRYCADFGDTAECSDGGEGVLPIGDVGEMEELPDDGSSQRGFDFSGSKMAVQVDVRMLKTELWEALNVERRKTLEGRKETEGGEKADAIETPKQNVSFSESVQRLRKSSGRLREVSVQYCFVCLLHLANENELELVEGGQMGDFEVKMD